MRSSIIVSVVCVCAAITRGGPAVELSVVAGSFLLDISTEQFNFLFVHYRQAVLNSGQPGHSS